MPSQTSWSRSSTRTRPAHPDAGAGISSSAMDAEDPRIASLEWIPRAMRTRMDEAGLRISLAQWQSMSLVDRRALPDAADEGRISISQFESLLALALRGAG